MEEIQSSVTRIEESLEDLNETLDRIYSILEEIRER